jgi:hypothetical protein
VCLVSDGIINDVLKFSVELLRKNPCSLNFHTKLSRFWLFVPLCWHIGAWWITKSANLNWSCIDKSFARVQLVFAWLKHLQRRKLMFLIFSIKTLRYINIAWLILRSIEGNFTQIAFQLIALTWMLNFVRKAEETSRRENETKNKCWLRLNFLDLSLSRRDKF